jgi:hypothetical protein
MAMGCGAVAAAAQGKLWERLWKGYVGSLAKAARAASDSIRRRE